MNPSNEAERNLFSPLGEADRWRWIGASGTAARQNVDTEQADRLVEAARQARALAYAPYSGFRVGAAVLPTGDTGIQTGCNVENASYGATICAERSAIAAAIRAGAREIAALALSLDSSTGTPPGDRSPCGICRQVLAEFGTECTVIYLDNGPSGAAAISGDALGLEDLLPYRFRLSGKRTE